MAELQDFKIYLEKELVPARNHKGRAGYCCPVCGSGTKSGNRSTGAVSVESGGEHWHCFSCDARGDIFDLFQMRDGLTPEEAARAVRAKYGRMPAPAAVEKPRADPVRDGRAVSEYVARCESAMPGSDGLLYLTGQRGLTQDTVRRFRLGWDADRRSIVIPYDRSGSYYITRSIDGKRYSKPRSDEAGREPIFNKGALFTDEAAVFVVESQLCAISIEQAGARAVALGGCSSSQLIALIQNRQPASTVVICLDNEPDKDKAEKVKALETEIATKLSGLGVSCLQDKTICGKHKDPNGFLCADRVGFARAIADVVRRVESERTEKAAAVDDKLAAYEQTNVAGHIMSFLDAVQKGKRSGGAIPTGFRGLDKSLGGGLFPGLYFVGAVSSLGKTTLALQIMDNIAASGCDVLVFSLEMARFELMGKSISRITRKLTKVRGLPAAMAKTTRGVMNGAFYRGYSDEEIKLIAEALNEYQDSIAPHIWIMEGVGDIGVMQVRQAVSEHITLTGRKPVVLIDYVQILAAPGDRLTDKQAVDKNVVELKRISRDFDVPVVGISSLNRDSYKQPISMTAFKESGAVEYTADVLIGLQYSGMDYKEKERDGDREKRIRELLKKNDEDAKSGQPVKIDVKLLKNRNGGRGMSDTMLFWPMFNLFEECTDGFEPVDGEKVRKVFDGEG